MNKHEKFQNTFFHGSGIYRNLTGSSILPSPWQPSSKNKKAAATTTTTIAILLFFFFFLFIILVATSGFSGLIHYPLFSSITLQKPVLSPTNKLPNKPEFPLQCTQPNVTQTCPTNYPTGHNPTNPDRPSSNITCPSYFRLIHEDLRPWKETGITRDMIERAKKTAHFRLVIVDGKAYVEKYKQSIQTRDMFTLWGILQLLRLYPGKLPDLELMFDCDDRPVVRSRDFQGPNSGPPPLFRYCSDGSSLDIVFPDWSFWGWAETNIKPWGDVLKDIKQGNKRSEWRDREPYAYWKGNPNVSPIRKDLLTCNVSEKNDWNTRLYIQDWNQESKQKFKQSNLGDQCTHRYKIYVEGWAWSVSEKYILACDSMTLIIRPHYHDFFSRGMVPLEHYWPIRENSKCTSLKFAVEWGNNHPEIAQAIGEAARKYIHEDMKMDYVYDYMFHLLNEYAKLLKFKPTIPKLSGGAAADEVCSETMACNANGNWKKFMEESMVMSPSDDDRAPCALPLPYDPPALKEFFDKKSGLIKQVESWENEYWQNFNKNIKQ
ncbi:hypothetical protein LWI29_015144 [Acer saccharum]|uniref:Glycosyl transferase CAP10 domain-containing protein n=1 Tax=Acer saccharum TaxID=4024 RepID=A0AA39VIB4_ACESA|nr:hypothetical protein LWI29_015144 [Acer saccharum]